MIDALLDRVQSRSRRSGLAALVWLLTAAWLSLAAFLGLRLWLADWAAALAVSGLTLGMYGLYRLTRRLRRQSAQSQQAAPNQLPEELRRQLERIAEDQPWLAVGVATGLGFAAGRNDAQLQVWLEQLPVLLAGLQSAQQAPQSPQPRA